MSLVEPKDMSGAASSGANDTGLRAPRAVQVFERAQAESLPRRHRRRSEQPDVVAAVHLAERTRSEESASLPRHIWAASFHFLFFFFGRENGGMLPDLSQMNGFSVRM